MLRLLLLLSLIAAVSGAYFSVQERQAYLPAAQAASEVETEALAPTESAPVEPAESAPVAAPAQTAAAQKPAASAPAPAPQEAPAPAGGPTRLIIPSIGLNSPVVKVGTNSLGEMDVPSGTTKNVGWYSGGTRPGQSGSAVIGAHVYAAFSNLHKVKPGNEIFVQTENGGRLRFVVTDAKTYELSSMSADALFNRKGGRFLHLITCAGELTADGSTYTHRRVVYATLAE